MFIETFTENNCFKLTCSCPAFCLKCQISFLWHFGTKLSALFLSSPKYKD